MEINKIYEEYLENDRTQASMRVQDDHKKLIEIFDDYIASVEEDSWKRGYEYAVSLMKKG